MSSAITAGRINALKTAVALRSCGAAGLARPTAAGAHALMADPGVVVAVAPAATGLAQCSADPTTGPEALLAGGTGAVVYAATTVLAMFRLAPATAAGIDTLLARSALLHRSAAGPCRLRRKLALPGLFVATVRRAENTIAAVGDGAWVLACVAVANVDPRTAAVPRAIRAVLPEL